MDIHVCAIDVTDEKLELAKSLGAEWTVNAATEQVQQAHAGDGRSACGDGHVGERGGL